MPSIVLTFDDGPIDAHVARSQAHLHDEAVLLAPLRAILQELDRHQARAVFFVEGPGVAEPSAALRAAHATGLAEIAAAGHLLAYHAYDHDEALWGPFATSDAERLGVDLDALSGFMAHEVAVSPGDGAAPIVPLFRPPFGGVGAVGEAGREAAALRGWHVRGFGIDAVDWFGNATANPSIVEVFAPPPGPKRVALSLDRIDAGLARGSEDILFHVNAFTAEHLGAFLEPLIAAREFAVPSSYLETSDTAVDLSFFDAPAP